LTLSNCKSSDIKKIEVTLSIIAYQKFDNVNKADQFLGKSESKEDRRRKENSE
jgi:hypothetical protein